MQFSNLHSIPTVLHTFARYAMMQDIPTPVPTEAVVYSVISANGQEQVAQTVFQITTGDMLIAVLLLIIAILLLAILITQIWRAPNA